MKAKQNKTRYSRIAVLLLMCLPVGIMAQEQKKDTIQRKENIKASEYMIPKRRGRTSSYRRRERNTCSSPQEPA